MSRDDELYYRGLEQNEQRWSKSLIDTRAALVLAAGRRNKSARHTSGPICHISVNKEEFLLSVQRRVNRKSILTIARIMHVSIYTPKKNRELADTRAV